LSREAREKVDIKKLPAWKLLLLILSIVLAGLALPSRFVVSTSASTAHRIFFNTAPIELKKGDYVVFYLTKRGAYYKDYKGKRLIKKIVCDEGDTLKVSEKLVFYKEKEKTKKEIRKQYWCNGQWLGEALTHDSKGVKLNNFVYNGKIPEGKAFVMGEHYRSYDSRYWGFLDKKEIIYKAIPLI
jgi:signal peptidase I